MINSFNNLNNCGKSTSVSCFDFSILYTTTPNDKLAKVLFKIIDFYLTGGYKKFKAVRRYVVRWINNEKQESASNSQSWLGRLWNAF